MNTLFIGQNSIHLQSINSTNSYASELLRHNRPVEGTVIYTFDQQNGRGQRGSDWESEPNKNIAFSLILCPFFLPAGKQFLLSKMIALSVADLMAEMLQNQPQISIKWPNDIYVGDQKIAGILIENGISENSIRNSIIGVGINVNQQKFESPKAISLSTLLGKESDLMSCLAKLCGYMEARYLQLRAEKWEKINSEYLQQLYRYNEWANYKEKDENFEGKIIGISEPGKLQVMMRNNSIKEFDLKEIEFMV